MDAAKKLPVDWNNYQITQRPVFVEHAACRRGVRSMMRGALIGVTVSAVLVLSLMLLLWMNDRRQGRWAYWCPLASASPPRSPITLTEMVLIGLPSLALGWLCAQGMAQWLGTTALHSVNASAAKELVRQHGAGRRRP